MQRQKEKGMNQRKLLRYENRLAVSGAAIIAFGAWNVVKAAIFFIVTPLEDLSHFFDSPEMAQIDFSSIPEGTLDIIVLVGVLAALMISLLVRFYIGRAAIQDSRRIRRRRITYVVFAALASLSLVMGVITRLFFAISHSLL